MTDEAGVTVTEPEAGSTNTVPTQIIDENGNLVSTWRNSLDEDIRNEKSLETFKTVGDIARSFVNTKRMLGKDKIAIPNKNSTPQEWEQYYSAVGKPKTSDDYQLPVPEEMKDYYDEELVKEARGMFHNLGFNQKQVDALWAFEQKRLAAGIKQLADEESQEKADAENILKEKWGTAYDERLHLANRMIAENIADDQQKEKVLAAIGNNPYVADFLANIAKKFIEHKVITDVPLPGQVTLDELQLKINEEMRTDAYLSASNPAHKQAVARVQRMFEEKVRMTAKK